MLPLVSVLIPSLGDEAATVASVRGNGYPIDRLEILVASPLPSVEGTVWIPNTTGSTPRGLNLAITSAKGEILLRVDTKATLDPGYIESCVDLLLSTGAANVGGVLRTISRPGAVGCAIATSLSTAFGVGNSSSRVGKDGPSDTVYGGCWRRSLFQRVGNFNERLTRGQDMEHNQRIRKAGGVILVSSQIAVSYRAPDSLTNLLKRRWIDGMWAILPFRFTRTCPIRLRHTIPLFFVLALLVAPKWIGAAYLSLNLGISFFLSAREKNWRFAPLLPVVYGGSHLAYGLGSWWGVVRLLLSR